MPQQGLGNTGLAVSRIGFGGAPIGLTGYLGGGDRQSDDKREEAIAAIRRAVDSGVTYFDTAPGYGDGLSESLFGAALAPVRDQIVLATKLRYDPKDNLVQREEDLAASLARLKTDRVDVLQIHGSQFDDATVENLLASGFLDWLAEIKRRGVTRAVGITAETPSGALERLVASGHFDVLQIAYSLIYQGACDYQREPFGIIPFARKHGLGIVTMRAATSGVLPRMFALAFPEIGAERLAESSIQFVLSTPEVDCALIGMRNTDEVDRNVALALQAPHFDLAELHNFYPNGRQ